MRDGPKRPAGASGTGCGAGAATGGAGPGCWSSASAPSAGTAAGTQGGTSGTPGGAPGLDAEVPILAPLRDCPLHDRTDVLGSLPGFEDFLRPGLIADLGHDAR